MTRSRGALLVVDDNEMNRRLLARLLEHEGYAPTTADDGVEALAALEGSLFDAVLLDIVMPGMDGIGVLQKMKNDSRLWDIPVIMISSVDESNDIARCIELGADDYLPKPFDPVVLRARVHASLTRKRSHDREVQYQRTVKEQAAELERLNFELRRRVEELEPTMSMSPADVEGFQSSVLKAADRNELGLALSLYDPGFDVDDEDACRTGL